MRVTVRLVTAADAEDVAAMLVASRESMVPWEPVRDESYFTAAGQKAALEDLLTQHARRQAYPGLVLADGAPAGRINLSNVVRGPFRSASLGYWVTESRRGAGVATAAVREVLRVAFDELGLHRVEAGTLLHNTASRTVLARNGFTEIGVAPRYLQIEGRWQDHLLHQRLADDHSG